LNQEKETLKEKEIQMSQSCEQGTERLGEGRALKRRAWEANEESRRKLNELGKQLDTQEKEVAYMKLALRHEMEDHKSTYSTLYLHLRSCLEAEKTVENVKKMRATKRRLREYVLPTEYFYSRRKEDEYKGVEEACDPIHDRSHDHDDQEDFLLR
jgi:hypothetical protein